MKHFSKLPDNFFLVCSTKQFGEFSDEPRGNHWPVTPDGTDLVGRALGVLHAAGKQSLEVGRVRG